MLDTGMGGPADHVRAARLLLQSAEHGHGWSRCVLSGSLSFLTAGTRTALKSELARLGYDSGAVDDLWDDAARAAYQAYIKGAAQPVRSHTVCTKPV
jgi:TPR repeat protein